MLDKPTRFSLVSRVISSFKLASIRASSGKRRLWANICCCCSFSSFSLFISSTSFMHLSLWTRSCSCIWYSRSLQDGGTAFNGLEHELALISPDYYYFITYLSLSSLHKPATALHLHSVCGCQWIWAIGASQHEFIAFKFFRNINISAETRRSYLWTSWYEGISLRSNFTPSPSAESCRSDQYYIPLITVHYTF